MTRRPVRAEDLFELRLPFDVQIAPDGKSVLWSERWIDRNLEKGFASLVRARVGEPPRSFTSGPQVDSAPRFSPDGSRIAFLRSVPGDKPRRQALRVIPTEGGESRLLLEAEGVFGPPAWSPDGRTIAIAFRKNDPEPAEGKPRRAIRVRRLPYKFDGQGYLPEDRFHLYRVDVDAAAPKLEPLTSGEWDDTEPAYSPDGRRIAFLSHRRGDRDLENRDVFVMPAEGGAPVQCKKGRGEAASPVWSPDGRFVVAHASSGPKTIGLIRGRVELFRFDPSGETPEASLTSDLDRNTLNLTIDDVWGLEYMGCPAAFSSDGRRVFFTVSDSGRTFVAARDLDDAGKPAGPIRPIVDDRSVVVFSVAPRANRLAVLTTTPTEPGRVEVGDLEGRERRVVGWPLERYVTETELRAPEEISVTTPDGAVVQGWLLTPEGRGPFPMLLDIHGGPIVQFGRTFFHEHQTWAALGYAVLYVNPRGSQGYGTEFSKVIHRDWGEKPFVDLMAAVDHVVATGKIDTARMGVMGGSYGGYMTNWVVSHTDRFRAACTQRTVASMEALIWSDYGGFWGEELEAWPWEDPALYERLSPLTYAEKIKTPLLIIQSLEDHRTPADQGERLYIKMQVLDKECELVLFPSSDHNLSRSGHVAQRIERLKVLEEWFGRYLSSQAK